MRLGFYDIEFAYPSIALLPQVERAALPLDHFILYMPSTGFSAKGNLQFTRLGSFDEKFDHYVLPTPHMKVGDYLPYDIIAFGDTLIPEEIVGTQVRRNNTGTERVLAVNTGATSRSS